MNIRTIMGMMLALQRLRQQERWTRPQLEAHQARALQRLRAHAYTHSPFYQKFHRGLAGKPLQALPVLTKAHLHEHFDEIVTDRRVQRAAVAAHVHSLRGAEQFLGRYFVTATSGTTGEPCFFLFNHAEWATVLASFTRAEHHIGSLWGMIQRPRLAVVASATPWHLSARIGATTRSSIIPMLRLDVGEPLAAIVRQLNAWQPQVLATYASMAGILADEQRSGRLRIAPTRIVSSAEVLTPALRQRVEAVWGERILFNQYGASEAGAIAIECAAHSGLHLFEDLVIFEVVDEQNRPVPPGVYGDKVLLTVLFNHTQPLIRYALTDSVRVAPGCCPCGCVFTRLDDIQGRLEEVLRFPTQEGGIGEAGTVAVHPMVFYRLLDAAPVAGWQVVQEPDRLLLRLSRTERVVNEALVVEAVQAALARQGAAAPPVTVQWVEGVMRGATGKAPRIISTIKT